MLIKNILWSLFITGLCVGVHYILTRWVTRRLQCATLRKPRAGLLCSLLLLAHLSECGVYAAFYYIHHCFSSLYDSLYFSITSFATVGYGDLLLPRFWEISGSLEGMTGALLTGWSVALLVAVVVLESGEKQR
ncbi:ion channel [Citrobacter youngae]|uniref:ion channel n=1 Tax=Citrobacter youngae TaxID=133448 RepID=UPI00019F1603|nr:ion channel [Citrobacter youngae]